MFFLLRRRLLTPTDTQVESSIFRLHIGRVSLESPRRSVIAAITVRSVQFVLESLVSVVLCVDESDRQESEKQEDDHRASPDDFNLKKINRRMERFDREPVGSSPPSLCRISLGIVRSLFVRERETKRRNTLDTARVSNLR